MKKFPITTSKLIGIIAIACFLLIYMVKSHIEGNAKRRAELTLYTEPYTNEIKRINADIERLEKSKKMKEVTTQEALLIDRPLARSFHLIIVFVC